MGNSVLIFYFSGTGNTKYVAEKIQESFIKKNSSCTLVAIEQAKAQLHLIEAADKVGIGFPVHAFNAPKIVLDFADALPQTVNKKTFIFKSAGDTLGNAGSTLELKNRLKKNGYIVFHESLYAMPTNMVSQYPNSIIKELCLFAQKKAEQDVFEINAEQTRLQNNSWPLNICSWLFSRFETFGACMLGRFHYRVSDACNHCKTCIKICPTKNICEKNNKIKFGWKCILCLRCIYSCPKRAIYIWLFRWMCLKDMYKINDILQNKGSPQNELSAKKIKFYSERFKDYLQK
ncbi:MAG: EFR1 family ferrodoxin [Gammaproteobacteria bacterium]|nr:EFR1 family ferrodoxin [Gammaproteobacteria bacterium]